MKSPYRHLKLFPLLIVVPLLFFQVALPAMGLQWPWFTKVHGIIAKPLLVVVILWSLVAVFLDLRWRARQKGPAKLSDCHACGYELTGETHEGRCPECNAAFKTP